MRNAQGYAVTVNPDGSVHEEDTFTCEHCNGVVYLKAQQDPASIGFCRMCMKPICGPCAHHGCTPFEKRMEELERRDRLMRACAG